MKQLSTLFYCIALVLLVSGKGMAHSGKKDGIVRSQTTYTPALKIYNSVPHTVVSEFHGENPALQSRISEPIPVNDPHVDTRQYTSSELFSKFSSAASPQTDITIFSGANDQRSPQIAREGSESFVAFENSTITGSNPYGSVYIYHSANNGLTWSYWGSFYNSNGVIHTPQIVITPTHIVVAERVNGYGQIIQYRRSDQYFSYFSFPSPTVTSTEYVAAFKLITDREVYSTNPWLYLSYLFRKTDGTYRVLFTSTADSSWTSYDELGATVTQLGVPVIGFDFGGDALYLSYIGTGLNLGKILIRKSVDFGSTWTNETSIPTTFGIDETHKKFGPFVIAAGDRVAVVYQFDYQGDATTWRDGSDQDVVATVSTDAGATWKEIYIGGSPGLDILPSVAHDADSSFYVAYLQDGNPRITMSTHELYFDSFANDSVTTQTASDDDFPSIAASTVSGTKNAYLVWTSAGIGLDLFGTPVALHAPPLSASNFTANAVSTTQVNLSWTDNSNDETGFRFYRKEGSASTYSFIQDISPNVTGFQDQGLTPGVSYGYAMRAYKTVNGVFYFSALQYADAVTPGSANAVLVSSFTPSSGPAGTTVTISGVNLNPVAASNAVYFGGVKAAVTSSSSIQLKVTVPAGATYGPISVTNTSLGATGYSSAYFVPTYSGGGSISSTSFGSKVNYVTSSQPGEVAIGDIDGDGKPDMVVTNNTGNSVSVIRNAGTSTTINNTTYPTRVNFTTGSAPLGVALADIDGDGKLDVVVSNRSSNTVSVYRNTSATGAITTSSLAPKVDFATGSVPSGIAIADIDGDGKPDIAVANNNSNTVSILRNTSTSGTIFTSSFAAKVDFTTGSGPYKAVLADIDRDGKPDLVVTNFSSNSVSVFRNTSTSGSITSSSFAAKVDFSTGSGANSVVAGDIDGDGRLDLVVTNYNANTISMLRNVGSVGSITSSTFSTKVDFTTGSSPNRLSLGDINGDGDIDIAVTNYASNSVSVFQNTSTSGSISSSSLAAKVDFTTGTNPSDVVVADLNADGKPDMTTGDFTSTALSVFQNITSPSTLAISSFTPTSGLVGTSVTITGTNFGLSQGTSTVKFGTVSATPTSWSNTQIIVPVPAGASGSVTISVTVNGTTAMSSTQFSVTTTSTVSVTSFNPTNGPIGSSVTILGSNFGATQGSSTVKFGIVTAATTSWSANQIVATVPSGLTIGTAYAISVTVGAQTATSIDKFTVETTSSIPSIAVTPTSILILNNGSTLNFKADTVYVTNSGGALLTGTISLSGISFLSPSTTTLSVVANGGKQAIVLSRNTSTAVTGTYTGILTITNNALTGAVSVSIKAKVFSMPTSIDITNSVAFTNPDKPSSYKLLSIPGTTSRTPASVITGTYKTDWRMYRDNGASSNFLSEYDGSALFNFGAGNGFWILSKNKLSVNGTTNGVNPSTGAYGIAVRTGWNIISNPFDRNVSWSDVQTYNKLPSNAVIYDWFNGSWGISSNFVPFKAYYYNNIAGTTTLDIPYDPDGTLAKSGSAAAEKDIAVSDQHLTLAVLSKDDPVSNVIAAFDKQSSNDFDQEDFLAPPSSFALSNIQIDNELLSLPYKRLFIEHRPEVGVGQAFDLVVTNKTSDVSQLMIDGIEKFEQYSVYIVDQQHSVMYDMKRYHSIPVPPSSEEQHFQLLVGTDNFIRDVKTAVVPNDFTLYQNYPNPFNPTTAVGYVLPEETSVTLTLFDVMGREVQTLVNSVQPAGYYAVQVNGQNLSSGVYYYSLRTDQFTQTKKMILLK